jgi:hypothetical protein
VGSADTIPAAPKETCLTRPGQIESSRPRSHPARGGTRSAPRYREPACTLFGLPKPLRRRQRKHAVVGRHHRFTPGAAVSCRSRYMMPFGSERRRFAQIIADISRRRASHSLRLPAVSLAWGSGASRAKPATDPALASTVSAHEAPKRPRVRRPRQSPAYFATATRGAAALWCPRSYQRHERTAGAQGQDHLGRDR